MTLWKNNIIKYRYYELSNTYKGQDYPYIPIGKLSSAESVAFIISIKLTNTSFWEFHKLNKVARMWTRTQNSHQRYSGENVSKSDPRVGLKGIQWVEKADRIPSTALLHSFSFLTLQNMHGCLLSGWQFMRYIISFRYGNCYPV